MERESDGLCLGDMGLSSDLSDDEVYVPENHGHQVTPGADTQVGSKDRLSVQKEASGPVRLMIHTLYQLIHQALAPDTNKCWSFIKLRLPVFASHLRMISMIVLKQFFPPVELRSLSSRIRTFFCSGRVKVEKRIADLST